MCKRPLENCPVAPWKRSCCGQSFVAAAIGKSQFHVVQWLRDRNSGGWSSHAAVINGQLLGLKWLHSRGMTDFTQDSMVTAASHGHFPIVKWIHSNVARSLWCTSDTLHVSVQNGHFEIAKWMLENDEDQVIAINSSSDGTFLIQLIYGNKTTAFDFNKAMQKGWFALVEWLPYYASDIDQLD